MGTKKNESSDTVMESSRDNTIKIKEDLLTKSGQPT
jgi:hypothetical protein